MEKQNKQTLEELRNLANDPALSPRAVLEIRQKRLEILEQQGYGPNT